MAIKELVRELTPQERIGIRVDEIRSVVNNPERDLYLTPEERRALLVELKGLYQKQQEYAKGIEGMQGTFLMINKSSTHLH